MNHESKSHHVAWADRIGLNKIWFQNIQACDISFGTEHYPNAVWRLYYSIVNIKNGPALKDIIDTYILEEWEPSIERKVAAWIESHPFESSDPANISFERSQIRNEKLPDLCYFMRQLLEDYGFGFYESNIEEDDVSLDE